jgi:hypothetical protein
MSFKRKFRAIVVGEETNLSRTFEITTDKPASVVRAFTTVLTDLVEAINKEQS